jgi:hypothetical protein
MGKINVGRLILGGIVAGAVFNGVDYLVDVVLLGPQWAEGFKALGHDVFHNGFSSNQLIGSSVTGFVGGMVAVWIYVGILPRFGPGPKTAIYAGFAVWVVGILLPNLIFMSIFGLFQSHLMLGTTFGALCETLPGAVAGAALYKE